ncbi:hypothetical protein MKO06_02145 [Gramella sp. GC03-9]|uniref:Uncharacterized protein n=1 Tax=Christiangramia oceanisediminis TaxID=2920386 RepID=A0A9X2KX94_9FLAO|nr:hypothetical protein [Gramella oceanisediminis]MCP9198691.1 hypothetical protein [Gramella oceanisediminis]
MFFKVGIKVLFIAVEIFLGFYSLVISDSLLLKFAFFTVTAGIIAFAMLKTIGKILPVDKDYYSTETDEDNI